jgi:hypothetical protein
MDQYLNARTGDRRKYTPDKDVTVGVCSWLCILAHLDRVEVEDVELERDNMLALSAMVSRALWMRSTFNIAW